MTNSLVRTLRAAAAFAVSALLWFVLTAIGGAGLVSGGVLVLFGAGWALVAAGGFLLLGALLIGRGMTHA